MIEVEKKFKPTDEQLEAFLQGAEFASEKLLHDLYYDYPDYRLYKKEFYFRKRGDNFELKIGNNSVSGVSEEVEGDENIIKRLGITKSLEDFVREDLIVLIDYKTIRKEYKKDGFIIDVDELSYGHKCVEIELQVEDESKTEEAKRKITEFVKPYGFEGQKAQPKRKEYFRLVKPEVFKQLYPNG